MHSKLCATKSNQQQRGLLTLQQLRAAVHSQLSAANSTDQHLRGLHKLQQLKQRKYCCTKKQRPGLPELPETGEGFSYSSLLQSRLQQLKGCNA